MIDIFYSTISGEEHERLDKLDAERRARVNMLNTLKDLERQRLPRKQNGEWPRELLEEVDRRIENLRSRYRTQDEPGAPKPRPWRPEQHAADTILGHFPTSGKAVTDE